MTNAEVGKYLNVNFVSSYQKVGTFTVDGARKQGGNVASYFCTPEGRVLHAIAGPVNAEVLLREARWVAETAKLAALDNVKGETRLRAFWRKAHTDRLQHEHHLDLKYVRRGVKPVQEMTLSNPGRVHYLLATTALPKLEQVYRFVFEKILKEKVSTDPVVQVGG